MKKKDINRAKRFFKEWHDTHPDEYAEFLVLVNDAIEKGNVTLFEKNFHILDHALPSKVIEYFEKKENNPFLWDSQEFQIDKMINASVNIMKDMMEFVPDFLSNLKKQSFDTKDPQLLSMYYWAFFEGGSIRIKDIYAKYLAPNDPDFLKSIQFDALITPLIENSVSNFMDTKKAWEQDNEEDADAIMKATVASILPNIKGVNAGRNDNDRELKELLIGDKERLMTEVENFIYKRKTDSELAFILYFLREAECIEDCEYMTFHRAIIRKYPDANIGGHDRAQSLFGLLTNRKANIGPRYQKKLEELKQEMFVRFVEAR